MVETLELGGKLPEAVGLGLEAIIVNGVWPERFSAADVKTLRAASRNGHDPDGAAAVRAALAEHDRARHAARPPQAAHEGERHQVVTLPYLFESELGLPEYQLLADDLAESL